MQTVFSSGILSEITGNIQGFGTQLSCSCNVRGARSWHGKLTLGEKWLSSLGT